MGPLKISHEGEESVGTCLYVLFCHIKQLQVIILKEIKKIGTMQYNKNLKVKNVKGKHP